MIRLPEGTIEEAVEGHLQKGGAVMMELPAKTYFESNMASLDALTRRGFGGLYISLERPISDVRSVLRKKGVDTGNVVFVDASAPRAEGAADEDNMSMHVSEKIGVDELVCVINSALPKLKARKRFILIDSAQALSGSKPLSELERFWEFLARKMRQRGFEDVLLILNVPKGAAKQSIFESAFRYAG